MACSNDGMLKLINAAICIYVCEVQFGLKIKTYWPKNHAIALYFLFQLLWMEPVECGIKENWFAYPKPAYISKRHNHFPYRLLENLDQIDKESEDVLMVVKKWATQYISKTYCKAASSLTEWT